MGRRIGHCTKVITVHKLHPQDLLKGVVEKMPWSSPCPVTGGSPQRTTMHFLRIMEVPLLDYCLTILLKRLANYNVMYGCSFPWSKSLGSDAIIIIKCSQLYVPWPGLYVPCLGQLKSIHTAVTGQACTHTPPPPPTHMHTHIPPPPTHMHTHTHPTPHTPTHSFTIQ